MIKTITSYEVDDAICCFIFALFFGSLQESCAGGGKRKSGIAKYLVIFVVVFVP